jgi:putative transposase
VVTAAREAHGISERRACSIIGADRSAMRYRYRRADDVVVRQRLKELAAERRRFGWRRLKLLLEREGIRMNHKKLRRLYAESGCRCVVAAAASEPWARGHR